MDRLGCGAHAIRIVGPNATARVATTAAPKRTGSGGFSVAEDEAPRQSQPVASLRTIGGIDALMALQGEDAQAERRSRAVKRGRTALDALDELKVELLGSALRPSTLQRLKSATTDHLDGSGDPKLGAVLKEIDLRVAVEIAKITPR